MESNHYLVKDLYIAANLLASGKRLLQLQQEGRFYWFVFENKLECEYLTTLYWKEENSLPPKIYADALRTLKDRLFAT